MLKHLHLLSTKTSALQNSNDELSFFAVVSLFGLIQSISSYSPRASKPFRPVPISSSQS